MITRAPVSDRAVCIVAIIAFVLLTSFLSVRNTPIADPQIFALLRILASASAAAFGASVPGFLNFKWEREGLLVRGGGAIALMLLTFFALAVPKNEEKASISQTSHGDFSPPINGNQGSVTVNGKK